MEEEPLALSLYVMKEVPPGAYDISFSVQNPPFSQRAPALQVQINSGGQIVIGRETVTSAPLLDAPLAVFGYRFTGIGQSNVSPNLRNVLTITLQPLISLGFKKETADMSPFGAVAYPGAPQILISNLKGAFSETGNISLFEDLSAGASACGEPPCASYFASHPDGGRGQGVFNNASKSLALFVTRLTDNATQYTFSFQVINQPFGQYPPNITILTRGHNYNDMEVLPLGKRNEAALLIGKFVTKSIGQIEDGRGEPNTLTVTFQANVDIAASVSGTRIEITNLVETGTESTPSFNISGNCSYYFGTNASWEKSTGTLSLTVQQLMLAHVTCVVSFDVLNPDVFQKDPDVKIRVVSDEVTFLHVSMDKAPGNLAPLFTSGWPVAFIEQSNPLANGVNIINITIAINSPMYALDHSKIYILGILNVITPSQSVPIQSNTHDVHALFSDGTRTGHVLLDPANGTVSMTVVATLEAGRHYNFWFVVRNPSYNQEFGHIEIYGQGSSKLVLTPMTVRPLACHRLLLYLTPRLMIAT
jgi:hypothetical protein